MTIDVLTKHVEPPRAPSDRLSAPRRLLGRLAERPWGVAMLLAIALLVANAVLRSSILNPDNWPAFLAVLAPLVLVALASTPPIIGGGGGIDISIGPLVIFTNCVFVQVLFPNGLGAPLVAVPLLLVIGAAIGLANGLLVVVVRLQPVIATLGTFFVLSGLSLKISPAPETLQGGNWTEQLGTTIGVVPGGLVPVAMVALAWLLLRRTPFVRTLYAVGGDDVACFSAGVNVRLVRIGAYVIASCIAVVAGIALTAVIQVAEPSLATTYALIALAAVSLGGTSFAGGNGGLLGSFLGACCIYLLQQMLSATGVSTNYVQMVYGVLLILGVVFAGLVARTRMGATP